MLACCAHSPTMMVAIQSVTARLVMLSVRLLMPHIYSSLCVVCVEPREPISAWKRKMHTHFMLLMCCFTAAGFCLHIYIYIFEYSHIPFSVGSAQTFMHFHFIQKHSVIRFLNHCYHDLWIQQ